LNEFDPIAEGITELEAVVTGERNALHDFDSKCGELASPLFQVAYFVSDVGFGGIPIHSVLHTDVDLAIPDLEPQATTPCEARRFLDFRGADGGGMVPPIVRKPTTPANRKMYRPRSEPTPR
jgi:hypothetical protein